MYNPAPMNAKPYDLVIFDCDGVLVESEPLACRIFIEMYAEYGYMLDYEETLREHYGVNLLKRMDLAAQKIGWAPSPAEFLPEFNRRLSDLTQRELLIVPGIHGLIDSLSVPICVASNGSREEITLRLKIANLTERFGDAIFSGTEVPHPKPAPDVYLAAAQAFNTPPSRCVVVEDSVLGVTAAVRAGMKVYGHAVYYPPDTLREAGAIPFGSMPELQKILQFRDDAVRNPAYILETERLTLQRFSRDDAPFILELVNDPSFVRNIGDRGVRTLEDAGRYIETGPAASYARNGFGLWLVSLKETGESIGMCGLIQRDALQDVDIGYAFLPKFWGRGYAVESARAVREYGKNTVGLTRLVAIVNPDNAASIRVLGRIGMTFERMIRLSPDEIELKLFGMDL